MNSPGADLGSGGPTVIAPSGDTTGVTDTANINGALSQQGVGATIELEAGTFYIDEPIVVPRSRRCSAPRAPA